MVTISGGTTHGIVRIIIHLVITIMVGTGVGAGMVHIMHTITLQCHQEDRALLLIEDMILEEVIIITILTETIVTTMDTAPL